MRTLPAGMQAHLDSGATTVCWCWRLERRDGLVLGFTDHDRDLAFGGTVYEAASGLTSSDIDSGVGLGVDNLQVEGALTSDRLDAADLGAGLYDGATVQAFRVNWRDVAQRVLMRAGELGEVQRTPTAFSAEVRGLAHRLQQPQGRLYQHLCDADLGDRRCGIAVAGSAYSAEAGVVSVDDGLTYIVDGVADYADGWFSRGVARFLTGANAGASVEIKLHRAIAGGVAMIQLWSQPPRGTVAGDRILVTAGCDKLVTTCAAKFENVANFRGFPFIPGNRALLQIGGRAQR